MMLAPISMTPHASEQLSTWHNSTLFSPENLDLKPKTGVGGANTTGLSG